jgi:hypothetical protein
MRRGLAVVVAACLLTVPGAEAKAKKPRVAILSAKTLVDGRVVHALPRGRETTFRVRYRVRNVPGRLRASAQVFIRLTRRRDRITIRTRPARTTDGEYEWDVGATLPRGLPAGDYTVKIRVTIARKGQRIASRTVTRTMRVG